MAKRVVPRRAHGKRSHRVDKDEKVIPIDHETAEIIAQPKKLFRGKFGTGNRVQKIRCFSTQASPRPNFPAVSPQKKYGRAYCRLRAGDSEIDPAMVYAMNKTGRIVTETNAQFLTDAELQEWNDAVDLWRIPPKD
jgi:hypothetical protein